MLKARRSPVRVPVDGEVTSVSAGAPGAGRLIPVKSHRGWSAKTRAAVAAAARHVRVCGVWA